ncbi:MAG: CinA family nicotinamide mononucleotide deamidase-related protein [Brevinematia bacterium]
MKCSLITIGTEITKGFILDLNSNFLSRQLRMTGIDVRFVISVGDNKSEVINALRFAFENSDFVITTGGLGPTVDDVTRECVSEFFGVEFVLSEHILHKIEEKFTKYSMTKMPKTNIKQAYVPRGGIVMENTVGSAPGYIIEKNGKILASLPGVPQEMKAMFNNFLRDYILRNVLKENRKEVFVKIFGIPESKVDEMISEYGEFDYNTIADYGVVDIIFHFDSKEFEEGKEKVLRLLNDKFREAVFFISEELEDIPSIVRKEFVRLGKTLSTAESMTGGYLSQMLTSVPGATEYFLGGVITYSDSTKISLLGVSEETISKYFATSLETTFEMAKNSLRVFGSNVSIAITGIAGPSTDSSKKEVGTAYVVAMSENGKYLGKELKLFGNRDKIRSSASIKAIELVMKLLRAE